MAAQSHAVDVGHPPSAVLRVVNPMLGFLLGTPLAGSLRKQLMMLDFAGRKSGRRFSLPVSAHLIDNDLYALTGAPWKHNFRGGATAQVRYDGRATSMRGDLIQDKDVVCDLYLRCAQSYDLKHAQRMMGLKFRDQRMPTREEFAEAVDRLHLAAIKLTPAR
ncbi:hypothetical protein [Mycobacterium basiliense]|nr:hypothetical protein [Mycobacterium basiliense]